MSQCVIIADDLTGANATGVLLQKMNYRTYTVMNTERLNLHNISECDCIIYPTDSRSVDKDIAYNRVYNVTNLLKRDEVKLYAKRIDSTLRGNIGGETDALLDALGEDYIAIAAPCFPQSGRIAAGGYLLVHSVPLHKTEAAIDPKTPVHTSNIQDIFCKQSKYSVRSLYLDDLMKGKEHLKEKLLQFKSERVRTITFDCIAMEDLELIADAVIESGLKFITVDPGPFTATVARKVLVAKKEKENRKILAVVGSVNPVAKLQMEEFLLADQVYNIFVKTQEFVKGDAKRAAEIDRVVNDILNHSDSCQLFSVIGDGIMPENRIDFTRYTDGGNDSKDELCNRINESFAEITYQILGGNAEFQGLYTSGGDITVAVSKRFSASGIRLLGEVLPLAAYGELINGDYDGMKIVTKGGMAGDKSAMKDCMLYLKEKLFI